MSTTLALEQVLLTHYREIHKEVFFQRTITPINLSADLFSPIESSLAFNRYSMTSKLLFARNCL